ncbi:MAG: IS200/IS605 family transposase [Bacteroidales bacterium]|nr:IS200/IS605 family transposase [Bacteroidales bacterium]
MLHSHTKNWVHIVWTTNGRQRILKEELRVKLFNHLIDLAKELSIHSERLNIQPEHVHILIILPADKTLAEIVKRFKGESSRWINENNLIQGRFRWQRGYGGFSVSASQLDKVKNYIENQDEHHRTKTFTEEYNEWLKQYKIEQVETAEAVGEVDDEE